MRIDEMIIKAKEDGETYFNKIDATFYSSKEGFSHQETVMYLNGWEKKPVRHLTVAEAEKELDCVIDVPDISKLFRPMSEIPKVSNNVIIVGDKPELNTKYCGFYENGQWIWYDQKFSVIGLTFNLHWIDPADLIKLLPKE